MQTDIWTIVCSASEGGPKRAGADATARQAQLAHALDAALQVSRPERVLVPLLEAEQPWWKPLLRALPAAAQLSQPIDRGCGVGLLVGLLRIRNEDPEATVVVFAGCERSEDRVDMARAGLTGLAAEPRRLHVAARAPAPDEPTTGLWMTSRREGEAEVSGAVVDPSPQTRDYLVGQGVMKALPVVVAKARALLETYEQLHPDLVAQAEEVVRPERMADPHALDELYPFVDAIDVERHVLAPVPERLLIVHGGGAAQRTTRAPESPQKRPPSTSNVAV